MRKLRQILAIVGIGIIAYFFISFIVKAVSGTTSIPDLMLAMAAMVVIPIVIYIMQRLAMRMEKDKTEDE